MSRSAAGIGMLDIEEIDTDKLRELASAGAWADITLKHEAPGTPYDGPVTLRMMDGSDIVVNAHVRKSEC
jgi:hypothetical protein